MLRDYQLKDVANIYTAWENHQRVMYRSETGSGKTVVLTSIVKEALQKGLRVMVIAHRKELISQTFNTFYKHQIFSGIIMGSVKSNYSLPCQICSIQTIGGRPNLPPIDLIIVDECHHCIEDNTYGKIIMQMYPNAKVLGVTATPYRLNGKGFTNIFNCMVDSTVNRQDLTNKGFLVPMRYYAAFSPNMTGARITAGDYNEEDSVKAMELAPLVESYIEHCKGQTGICFAVNVKHSKKIVSSYLDAGIKAAHLDANTPSHERQNILNLTRSKDIKVLVNVGITTEGTDIPSLDFTQLARPTLSLSLLSQMIGRPGRVDNATIAHCQTDAERVSAIAASLKPFGTILDNAGMYKKHIQLIQEITGGTPINWRRYFEGFKKRKKVIEEMIEVEYIVEDQEGVRKVAKDINEIEGLRLIEITQSHTQSFGDIAACNEFDRIYWQLKNIPHVKKVGFTAFYDFIKFCDTRSITISDAVWEHLKRRLSTEHKNNIQVSHDDCERMKQAVHKMYAGHDNKEYEFLCSEIDSRHDKLLDSLTRLQVPSGFIMKEKEKPSKLVEA